MNWLERRIQKLRNWMYDYTDSKLVFAAFVFICACLYWWF